MNALIHAMGLLRTVHIQLYPNAAADAAAERLLFGNRKEVLN